MGLSIWHLLILGLIVLLLFGPNRLPSLGKSLGEAIRGFKKGLDSDEIDVTNTAARKEQIRDADEQKAQAQTTTEKDKV